MPAAASGRSSNLCCNAIKLIALVGVLSDVGESNGCNGARTGAASISSLVSAGVTCIESRTLAGLNGYKPAFDQPDRILRDIMAIWRARLYRRVK